jgi:hypothetical protein
LLAGCSGSEPTLAEVKGQLKMNGKPLKNVKVEFQPDPDKGTRGTGSTGVTDEQGNFTLKYSETKTGAIVGHHRVILSDLDLFGNVFVGRGDYRNEDGKGGQREVPKLARFPDMYGDLANTPLRQEVTPGMSPITLEIKGR